MAEIFAPGGIDSTTMEDIAAAKAITAAYNATEQFRARQFTVQEGGADPLFAFDATMLAKGTIVTVADLGGCGAGGAPGRGLCMWMGEWRRLSRGLTATLPVGTTTLDAFKDPMRIAYTGSLLTQTRAVLVRPYLGAKWSFIRPGLASATTALGVNLAGNTTASDIALVGPAINFVEFNGAVLAKVEAE